MAYNPGIYQPYFPNAYNAYATPQNVIPQQPTQPTQPVQQNSGLIWIQGEAAAKSYMVAPGTTVALWDSEAQTIYLKSADASGMPSMRILDYSIRDNAATTPKTAPKTDYATKDDINSIQEQINEIRANMGRKKGVKNESVVSADE